MDFMISLALPLFILNLASGTRGHPYKLSVSVNTNLYSHFFTNSNTLTEL